MIGPASGVRSMTYDEKGHKQKAQKANGNWILILIFFLLLDVELNTLNDGPEAAATIQPCTCTKQEWAATR